MRSESRMSRFFFPSQVARSLTKRRVPDRKVIVFAVCVAFLLSGPLGLAQLRIVGAVSGIIEDPTGAVIPNAKVVLKDVKTGLTKETTSSERGTFFFPDLASGVYEITVTASGFQTAVISNVVVSTSQTTDVRVRLEIGRAHV